MWKQHKQRKVAFQRETVLDLFIFSDETSVLEITGHPFPNMGMATMRCNISFSNKHPVTSVNTLFEPGSSVVMKHVSEGSFPVKNVKA